MKQAFTLKEFCEAYQISRGRLYELQRAGLGPVTYSIASRPYVSASAAADWQKRMETGAAANFRPLPAKTPGQRGRKAVRLGRDYLANAEIFPVAAAAVDGEVAHG